MKVKNPPVIIQNYPADQTKTDNMKRGSGFYGMGHTQAVLS